MPDRILFKIWENRTLPADLWERFTAKARAAGSTPARVLRELIERYTNERPPDDTSHQPTPPAPQ